MVKITARIIKQYENFWYRYPTEKNCKDDLIKDKVINSNYEGNLIWTEATIKGGIFRPGIFRNIALYQTRILLLRTIFHLLKLGVQYKLCVYQFNSLRIDFAMVTYFIIVSVSICTCLHDHLIQHSLHV